MHYRKQSLLPLLGALVLAACAKDGVESPAVPTGVARSVSSVAPSCDFVAIKASADSWFATPLAVKEIVTDMQIAHAAGGANAATSLGFDVLAKVSSLLATPGGVVGLPATGDAFVKGVLACMSVGTLPATLDFEGSFAANGLFAVVGGLGDPTGPVTSRSLPTYGAEPQTGATWAGSAGNQRYLLYGYERGWTWTPETPAAATAFELASVPTPIAFSPALAGGMCETTVTNSQLQSVNAILAPVTLSFCPNVAMNTNRGTGFFAAARRAVTDLFTPSPLYARVGGTGGLLSGLSPKGAVTFAPAATGLSFVQQPLDTKRSLRPQQFAKPISVSVRTANGTSVGGVLVTLTPVNNKGSWQTGNNTAFTDANGIAVFPHFYIDKSGGYNLVASGVVFNGLPTKSASSNRFNINGQ